MTQLKSLIFKEALQIRKNKIKHPREKKNDWKRCSRNSKFKWPAYTWQDAETHQQPGKYKLR